MPAEDPERDRALIRAVARGSGDAVADLYDRYGATVYGLALRVLGQPDLAEEVAQDVFAQVWREAARYDAGRSTVAGWIVMLTRTRAIDRSARAARASGSVGGRSAARPRPLPWRRPTTPESITILAETRAACPRRARAAAGSVPIADRAGVLRRADAQRNRRTHGHSARHRQDAAAERHGHACGAHWHDTRRNQTGAARIRAGRARSADEQAEVAAHVATCDACAAELAVEGARRAASIGLDAPPVTPPAAPRARVLARVASEPRPHCRRHVARPVTRIDQPSSPLWSAWLRWPPASLLAVGASLYAYSMRAELVVAARDRRRGHPTRRRACGRNWRRCGAIA